MKHLILILIIPFLFSCKKEDPVILVPEYTKVTVISSGNNLTPYKNGVKYNNAYDGYVDLLVEFKYNCFYDEPQIITCKKYTFDNLKIGDNISLFSDKELCDKRWRKWQVYKDDIMTTDGHSEYCYQDIRSLGIDITIRGIGK